MSESSTIEEERNQELENILGNLLIAEYQVDKLKGRLAEKLMGNAKNNSTFTFKHDKKLVRVRIQIDDMDL